MTCMATSIAMVSDVCVVLYADHFRPLCLALQNVLVASVGCGVAVLVPSPSPSVIPGATAGAGAGAGAGAAVRMVLELVHKSPVTQLLPVAGYVHGWAFPFLA